MKTNMFSFFKFPNKGTTSEVGGIISASRRKNTVRESRMLMDKLTWENIQIYCQQELLELESLLLSGTDYRNTKDLNHLSNVKVHSILLN